MRPVLFGSHEMGREGGVAMTRAHAYNGNRLTQDCFRCEWVIALGSTRAKEHLMYGTGDYNIQAAIAHNAKDLEHGLHLAPCLGNKTTLSPTTARTCATIKPGNTR